MIRNFDNGSVVARGYLSENANIETGKSDVADPEKCMTALTLIFVFHVNLASAYIFLIYVSIQEYRVSKIKDVFLKIQYNSNVKIFI